jgi:hypothetical protein
LKIDQTPLVQLKQVIDGDSEAQAVRPAGATEPGP